MTDHVGRTGTAVSLVDDHDGRGRQRFVLVFDPDTSMLLEQETVQLNRVEGVSAKPPVTIGYTTYLTSEIVPTIP